MVETNLPNDCEIRFTPDFLAVQPADQLYRLLKEKICLQAQEMTLPGGVIHILETPKTMFTDPELFDSDEMREAFGERLPWFPELYSVRQHLEKITQRKFPVCVAIYYSHGSKGVDYHSDLRAFGDTSCIPSLSLGAERTFSLRNLEDPGKQYDISLPHGSLVIMGENCQERYAHALLQDSSVQQDRINLTFRGYGN
ncbi:MAG: alpha-ketoglutarate-dependent dioxygenase AlkB [Owenweeksia sp.]